MRSASDTKQKLIVATKQMIDTGGVDSVSLREIGKKVELSRSAVYRHFKSKEDLLSAVVLENFNTLQADIRVIVSRSNDSVKTLADLMKYYYCFGTNNKEHYRLMFCSQFDKDQYPDVYSAALQTFGIVTNCIVEAQKQNHLIGKSAIDLTAMAYSFIHGLILLSSVGHNEPEKGLDQPAKLIDSFINMIKCDR